MRILLIEDDTMIGKAVQRGLSTAGFAIDWVTDGRAAELALGNGVYDLAILDLGLPKKDGMAILSSLRALGNSMPVLIASARDTVKDRIEGLDAGADDVESDEDGHWIYCRFEALVDVSDALEKALGESTESKLIWKAQVLTEVDLDTATKLLKLIEMLEEDDDVQAVTHNFDIPEDVAALLDA